MKIYYVTFKDGSYGTSYDPVYGENHYAKCRSMFITARSTKAAKAAIKTIFPSASGFTFRVAGFA